MAGEISTPLFLGAELEFLTGVEPTGAPEQTRSRRNTLKFYDTFRIPIPGVTTPLGTIHIHGFRSSNFNFFSLRDLIFETLVEVTLSEFEGKSNIIFTSLGNYDIIICRKTKTAAGLTKRSFGLNLTGFEVQSKFYPSLQPRLSGRYLINDKLSAKVGYAYMTQYLHLLSTSTVSLPTDLWVPVTAHILPMNAHQVAAGLFYNLLDSLHLSVEGYYKNMNNLLEYKDGASFFLNSQGWEQKVCMGRGWAYGIEFLAQKTVGKLTGWLGYTWSHTYRLFDRPGQQLNNGEPFPAKYDRRHDVSIVLTYKFSDRFDASLTWVFSSGNAATLALQQFDPTTGIPEYGSIYTASSDYVSSRNNYRMPNYHRMDVSLNWHKELKYGRRTINLSVYNVYNRLNPYMLYIDYSWNGNRKLNQLSIFPIIPTVSYLWQI